ncbi:uncharacterized protein PAE49_017169 isoform 2-T2 [Odontesthes bonariensis]|uniref:uncharacterized protein LOC142392405 n=1 Tax=Odontesthes bonariensis TaxID=219752 RepID=UPI003F58BC30
MFRISLTVSVSLIFCVTAKPWIKPADKPFQEAVLSIDDNGKLTWEVEVEPPEDMDGIHHEIDPRMRIWKSMAGDGQDKQPLKAEEDLDELYHPSLAELQDQIQNMDPPSQIEKDADKLSPVQIEPEEDMDDLYHKDPIMPALYQEEPRAAAAVDVPFQAKYSEPEEDMDDLYHKHPIMPAHNLEEPRAAAAVDVPFQAKYSEPEEDMDDRYHP